MKLTTKQRLLREPTYRDTEKGLVEYNRPTGNFEFAILDGDALDREATATLMAEQSEFGDYASAHEEPRLPWPPEQLETRFIWRG